MQNLTKFFKWKVQSPAALPRPIIATFVASSTLASPSASLRGVVTARPYLSPSMRRSTEACQDVTWAAPHEVSS